MSSPAPTCHTFADSSTQDLPQPAQPQCVPDIESCGLQDSRHECLVSLVPPTSSSPIPAPPQPPQQHRQEQHQHHDQRNQQPSPATLNKIGVTSASRLDTYMRVRATGLPNYMRARIPLQSSLNIDMWRLLTHGHSDLTLCDMLQYGFPLGFEGTTPPTPTHENHKSATAYPESVNDFIKAELAHGSLMGPFNGPPFWPWCQVSPLMTRPKRGSHSRRVIVDLSFPHNASVNSFTPADTYCGMPFKLRLPSADTLQRRIGEMNCECFLYSCDISRAYRNIPTDPLAWPLCNIQVEGKYYIDTSLSFGARWSAASCQRVTDGIKYIMANNGHTVFNYIDDICGVASTEAEAWEGFLLLKRTLKSLGLPEAEHKACPPAPSIVWLGIEFDTRSRTMRIPQDKIRETKTLVYSWLSRPTISLKNLRSLLGKLLHVAQCSRPARLFLNRILASYRAGSHLHAIPIDDEFKRDLQWFNDHLPQCNGLYMMESTSPSYTVIECDSCLSGCGAIWHDSCHHTTFPHFITAMNLSICHMEALNCVVSLKLWAEGMKNSTVKLWCDSMVTVNILLYAKGRDPFLLKCAREIWLLCARYNIKLLPSHVPGSRMTGRADALSRFHINKQYEQTCINLINENNLQVHEVDPYLFKLQASL
jgi:hypothetical protein